ncbi:hypothetical protein D3C72_1910380 [compost metagenome]
MLLADHAAAVGDRVAEGLREDVLGDLAAQRFQNLQFGFIRQPAGGHFGILEVTAGAGIGAVEQLLVGPFEVQQQAQRLPNTHILEHRAAYVVDKSLHAGRVAVGELFQDQALLPHGRHVVSGGPAFGCSFQAVVELTSLQCFEGH